jgi:hypothetical protein
VIGGMRLLLVVPMVACTTTSSTPPVVQVMPGSLPFAVTAFGLQRFTQDCAPDAAYSIDDAYGISLTGAGDGTSLQTNLRVELTATAPLAYDLPASLDAMIDDSVLCEARSGSGPTFGCPPDVTLPIPAQHTPYSQHGVFPLSAMNTLDWQQGMDVHEVDDQPLDDAFARITHYPTSADDDGIFELRLVFHDQHTLDVRVSGAFETLCVVN